MSAQALLQQATGLNLTSAAAERAVRARMAVRGIAGHDAYLAQLAGAELSALIELVVVPESWMFRDADAFTQAARAVDRLVADGRSVRILSIPCAAGEEPYSMAMALHDAGIPDNAYAIDAVDLSAAAIERARTGIYTRNAFRGSELGFRERYFSADGANFRIDDTLRRQVRFQQGNLLTFDAARYDIVFCRNLLIYFDDATIEQAIVRLDALLLDDGLLFAGYAEVPAFCRHGFATARLPGAFALRKDASAPPAPASAPRPAPAPVRARRAAPAPSTAPRNVPARVAAPPAPPDHASLLAQARRQADQGDFKGAAASCASLLAADGTAAEAYFILGMVEECRQNPAQAEQHWRRCIYLQPDHYEALCHLALLAEQSGNDSAARTFKQRAARIYERQNGGGAR